MHKWFARRSSSIFRAILLAAALPYKDEKGQPIDLMKEFYKGHGNDLRMRRPDGTRLRVLDPFMGGGTTVVEALRLGFEVTSVDYNPIAWFIVKGETTPVDLGELDAAYQRVADKVKDELMDLYKTKCPVTGKDADIVYGFWVKQGICVEPDCGAKTDLFKSYVVARKRGDATIKYAPDVQCPHCKKVFDWEFERASVTAGGPQVQGEGACGSGRPKGTAYAFGLPAKGVKCPHCKKKVGQDALAEKSTSKKKTEIHVIWDPTRGKLFDVRGKVPKKVKSPLGEGVVVIEPKIVQGGKFVCGACGRTQEIVESARRHGALPFRYYAFYAYSPNVEGLPEDGLGLAWCGGKWFGTVSTDDLAKLQYAEACLDTSDSLPSPTQEIADGYNTNRLVIHQYRQWRDLYGARQQYALGRLLMAIAEEENAVLRDALLGAFQATLNYQSFLCRYNVALNKIEGVQASHDYRNPTTSAENPVWGAAHKIGRGSFSNYYGNLVSGLRYQSEPDLYGPDLAPIGVNDCKGEDWQPSLHCRSSTDLNLFSDSHFDVIVTDPPYAGSVQYAEMSDWYYVWLHHVLKNHYPSFQPEITLKSQEIIEDCADKDQSFFFTELTNAWKECHRVLKDDGLLVFTFHHAEGDRWTGLLASLFDAGFYLVAAYPTHSEALNSIVIQATKGITYDIIHVCRKRLAEPESIPWTKLRRDVRKQAREQLTEIEQGKDVLPGPDVQMILIGRALMLFSRHYGKVLDSDGTPMNLDEAMERILLLVREVRGDELPLPGKLQNIDSLTQIVLLHVVGKQEWTRDDLHKELRGYKHGPKELLDAGLVRTVAGDKGKLEPVPAAERYRGGRLSKQASGPLVDKVHLILGTIGEGHSIEPLMDGWRGQWEPITEALIWIAKSQPELREPIGLARRQIESLGPEGHSKGQMGLFSPEDEA